MVKELVTNDFNDEINKGVTFVDFYADWCMPCKMMSPVVEELSNKFSDVKFIKVNVDNYNDLAIEYRVSTIPRFLIFKDGELKSMSVGVCDIVALEEKIKSCMM